MLDQSCISFGVERLSLKGPITSDLCTEHENYELMMFWDSVFDNSSSLDHFLLFLQVPIIPVVFSSYSNFYLRKEKQFKSGNFP